MKRFSACPRRFSFTTTPLTRYWLSKESAPAIMMLPLGPLPATAGASSTASFSARPTGRRSSTSFLKLLAMVMVGTISADCPVTVTVSETDASVSVASSVFVSAIFTGTLCRLTVTNPCSSNVTWYSPAGRNGMM
jgi:hypothetical protein